MSDAQHDLRLLAPIAAKAILYSIPASCAEDALKEIKDFANDRGAIHYFLHDYLTTERLEDALLRYWETRTSDASFRIEVTLGSVLISLAISIIGTAIYDASKKRALPIAKKIRNWKYVKSLEEKKEKHQKDVISLLQLLEFRNYLYSTPGCDDREEFKKIFTHLKDGGTLSSYLSNKKEITQNDYKELDNISMVVKGLITTPQTTIILPQNRWELTIDGISLAAEHGFGEVIDCSENENLEEEDLFDLLNSGQQHPNEWPRDLRNKAAPKIVVIKDDQQFKSLIEKTHISAIPNLAGIATYSGGMTSHVAVWSRFMASSAIVLFDSVPSDKKFCAIAGNKLLLSQYFPSEHESQIRHFLEFWRRRHSFST